MPADTFQTPMIVLLDVDSDLLPQATPITMAPPHSNPVVEQLAQRKFRLESLFEEQASVIRQQPGGYQAVYERNLHGFATKPADRWIPADAAEMEKNTKMMQAICDKTPTSIDEQARKFTLFVSY